MDGHFPDFAPDVMAHIGVPLVLSLAVQEQEPARGQQHRPDAEKDYEECGHTHIIACVLLPSSEQQAGQQESDAGQGDDD